MIPKKITFPFIPQFIFAPDEKTMELYIISTAPLALFWIRQTIPAQIYIVLGFQDDQLLKDCAEWYRAFAQQKIDKN